MKLSEMYLLLGWPPRTWKTTAAPPEPIAHDVAFDDMRRLARTVHGDPEQQPFEEIAKKCAAMDARYDSLKQGESLGKLSTEELCELRRMETGWGLCLDLSPCENHERLGQRSAYRLP